jgi:hypothetical protein
MNNPHLAIGQEVIFVGSDKKNRKGTITRLYSESEAHIEWDGGSAVAAFSDKNEPGTFHFEQASPKAESQK